MYANGRPDERARAVHRRYVDGWLPRLLPIAAVLHVRGRVTGAEVNVPVVVVPYRWQWYTVAMLGEKANWVHNVRAAGGEAELTHGRRRPVRLVEVAAADRARIIRRYLVFALGARPHLAVRWHDPLEAFDRIAPSHPTFLIERRARRAAGR
jgi:hypothetical protein